MKNNEKIKIVLLIFLVLSLISSVYGFGVSSSYWVGNPLSLAAGETKIVDLNLQNVVGIEDVNVKVEIKEGLEIASLEKDVYVVKAGTSDTMVPIKIKIPREEAEEKYDLSVEVKTITSGEGGTVALGTGMVVSFEVLIFGEVEETNIRPILIGVISGLVILIILIVLILKKIKKKKKSK